MSFDRRDAAFAGAVGLLIVWWAEPSRKPSPVERAVITQPGAPDVVPDQGSVRKTDSHEELEPPAPVLRHSAERRFSNPSSYGAADGSIAGAEAERASADATLTRLAGVNVKMPGGYHAPTARVGTGTLADGTVVVSAAETDRGSADAADISPTAETDRGSADGTDRGSDARGVLSSNGDHMEVGNTQETLASADKKLTGAAASMVKAAHGLKTRRDTAAMRASSSLEAGIMRQLELDNKVDAAMRGALKRLALSGEPVTEESEEKVAENVLRDNGLEPEDEDIKMFIARASGPSVQLGAHAAVVKAIASMPSLSPEVLLKAEIEHQADNPPSHTPAPHGTREAYRQHKGVFDKALKDFGVKPEDILAILKVESDLGRGDMGKYPLPGTFMAKRTAVGPGNRPTKAANRAVGELAALARLSTQGDLGGRTPGKVYGSYAGAMGIPQFLPTSWDAYSRAPNGGKRDPFNFDTAIYSVANYLRANGYSRDVARSIWRYNHSKEYVDKVQRVSAGIKAHLNAAAPPNK